MIDQDEAFRIKVENEELKLVIKELEVKAVWDQLLINKLRNQPTTDQKLNSIYTKRTDDLVKNIEVLNRNLQATIKEHEQEKKDLLEQIKHFREKYGYQRPIYYEDRNDIELAIFELISDKIKVELVIPEEEIDNLIWTDELLREIDEIFEPYTNGSYRNYN